MAKLLLCLLHFSKFALRAQLRLFGVEMRAKVSKGAKPAKF